MHLIKALAAGVSGAESGTALIYQRGTSTKSDYYTDFEGAELVTATPATVVTLDAYGSVEVYVNQYVDVVVKSSGGTTVRTFTAGSASANVEVRSASFTGTSYDGLTTAASQPTTLETVLDRWLTSAGAIDWKVDVAGVATNLSVAASGAYGVFFNVKSSAYGAVGDGSTNDYVAILAAVTAAAVTGGIVYFPPGTYDMGTALTVPANVSLMGAGPNASIIETTGAATNVLVLSGSPTYTGQSVSGLTLKCKIANTGLIISFTGSSRAVVRDCYLGGANSTAANGLVDVGSASGKYIRFDTCVLVTGGAASKMIISNLTHRTGRVEVVGCRFVTPASLTHGTPTTMGLLEGSCFFVRDCLFDNSAASAGAYSCIYAGSTCYGSVRGCEFLDSAGATVTCMALGTLSGSSEWFEEDGNILPNAAVYLTLYSLTHSTDGYYVKLGTREARYKEYSITTTGPHALDFLNYAIISVLSTYAGGTSYTATMGAVGSRVSLLLLNEHGSNQTFTLGASISSFGAYNIDNSNGAAGFEFVAMSPAGGANWFLTGYSGSNATAAHDSYAV